MLRVANQYRTNIFWLALALKSSVTAASPPSVPQTPRPEQRHKSHTKLTAVLKLPRTDWERRKFHQARIGDFVEYESSDGTANYRRTVEEVGDHTLVVVETKSAKSKAAAAHIQYSFELPDEAPGPGNELGEAAGTVAVLGQAMPGRIVEIVYHGKKLEQRWYGDDVPLGGLVKLIRGESEVLQSLTAYGHGPQ